MSAEMGGRAVAPDPTRRLRQALTTTDVDDLAASITDPSPEVARAAIDRLAALAGQRAAPALRRHLLDVDLALVPDLARALREVSDASAVDLALAGLRDERYTRRLAAVVALGVFAEPRSAELLRRSLSDEIGAVRAAALRALAKVGVPAHNADCLALMSDPDPQVRIAAIRAAVQLSASPASAIASSVEDENCLVRLEVAHHVRRLPDDAAGHLLRDPEAQVRQAAAEAAGLHQARLLGEMLARDADSGVRRAAAHALGKLSGEEIADALIGGIDDRDPLVRAASLHALECAAGRERAVGRILIELGTSDPGRRRAALYALAHLRAADIGNEVWRLADDPEPEVRLALLDTAAMLVGDAEPLVSYMTTDPDPAVRHAAENRHQPNPTTHP